MRLRGRPSQRGVRGPANDRAYAPVVEGGFRSPDVARGEDELARLDAAIQQLERAELYVAAALEVGLEDPFRRRVLEDLRCQVAAARRSLARPRVIDQAFSR
ncbi:MAG TPA: hypothetical protein VKI99_15020 [Candidatus Dormibacteraeota bacterium]|nr:hypothetical protein [Candidatus Dormibacteraeota bacterium]